MLDIQRMKTALTQRVEIEPNFALDRETITYFFEQRGAGMAQWWEHSPSTNVARVRFLVLVSYVGWVCCWFSSLLRGFFSGHSGFPPFIKPNICKFQFDQEVKCLHTSPWLGRLGDYSLTMTLNLIYDFFRRLCWRRSCKPVVQDIKTLVKTSKWLKTFRLALLLRCAQLHRSC